LVGDAALTQMEGQMSTTKTETLAGIEQGIHGIAATQKSHGGLLNIIAKRQEEIIKLLTPELKDGPTFDELTRIIHEKCAIKAKPLISLTTMRMGCLMKFFAMKFLAQVFGGLGRFRAVR